jgi:peptide/nickel transport system permease protein
LQSLGRYVRVHKFAGLAIFVVLVAIFLALFGSLIAPYSPTIPNPAVALQAPSFAHPFGTDESGFDIFSQSLAAPRTDLGIALGGTAIALLLGAPLGIIAGYNAGRLSVLSAGGETMMRVADIIQSFPVFILALGLVAVRGPSALNVIVAIAFVNFPIYLRLFRSETLSLRERAFVDAARASGLSDLRIARRHIFPNALGPASVQVSVSVGFAILLTAGLSFIGAGVRPPTPELGSMVSAGSTNIVTGQWWPSVFPGLVIGVIVLAFAVTGDALGVLLDPTRRS